MEDWCMYCSSWYNSRNFMETYGEGCGKCMKTGAVTFCTRKCIYCDHRCDPKEEKEIV